MDGVCHAMRLPDRRVHKQVRLLTRLANHRARTDTAACTHAPFVVFDASFEKRITINGDGSQSRSFIHVHSIARALAAAATTDLAGGTYNLVERSIKVMDIVDELKQLLPDLEFILINQHMKLSNLLIQENENVNRMLGLDGPRPLKDELQEFLGKFSF